VGGLRLRRPFFMANSAPGRRAAWHLLHQNPNAMYDKGRFCLPLWYDKSANLMSDIVARSAC